MPAVIKVDRTAFAEAAREGATNAELVERFACNPATVSRLRRSLGVPTPRWSRVTPEKLARIEELLDDGVSVAEVCRTVGVDDETVSRHFPGRAWDDEHRLAMLHETARLWKAVGAVNTYATRISTPRCINF